MNDARKKNCFAVLLWFAVFLGTATGNHSKIVHAEGTFETSNYQSHIVTDNAGGIAYRIRRDFIFSMTPYFVLIIGLSLLCLRLIFILNNNRAERLQGFTSQQGTSAVQFILVFPILLILLLTILQIALIVQAKFVVNYAAFCAVRSAIVTIPARVTSDRILEEHNVINVNNPESPKVKIIQRAAALPIVGISPKWSPGIVARTGSSLDASALLPLANLVLFVPGQNYLTQLLSRAPYAYDRKNTEVQISSSGGSFTDGSAITVKVTHRYFLTVPFADRLFGTSYFGGSIFAINSSRYAEINEQYTLFNEGEPRYPESQKKRFGDTDLEVENY